MVRYVKCPRCELNYIDAETQEYCEVCLKEMRGLPTDTDEIEEAEEEFATELCPVCGENMMRPGEKMCEECRKKAEYEEEPDPDEDDEWRNYLDDDTDTEMDPEMGEIGEAFGDEFADVEEEEEDDEYHGEDDEEDLEYVTGDDIYRLSEGDDEDDEDDDDDF